MGSKVGPLCNVRQGKVVEPKGGRECCQLAMAAKRNVLPKAELRKTADATVQQSVASKSQVILFERLKTQSSLKSFDLFS